MARCCLRLCSYSSVLNGWLPPSIGKARLAMKERCPATASCSLRMFLASPTKLRSFVLCRRVAAPTCMSLTFSVRGWRRKPGIPLVAPGQVRKSWRAQGTRTSVYCRAERVLAWGKQNKTVAKCHQTARNSCFYLGQRLPISKLAAVKEKIKTRAVSHRLLREGTL